MNKEELLKLLARCETPAETLCMRVIGLPPPLTAAVVGVLLLPWAGIVLWLLWAVFA